MARLLCAPLLLAALSALATPALAAPILDVEIDPIAYALGGYSVHAGVRHGAWRFDLGAFALDVPEAVHGQDGFEQSMGGFGLKVDHRPFASLPNLFFGVQMSVVREAVRRVDVNITETQRLVTAGPRVGYQIDLGAGFYVVPWMSVDVVLTDRALDVAGETFDAGRLVPFPTLHLGYVQ